MKLIPLTPLHIGCDTELTPCEFIYEQNRVRVYPLEYLLSCIMKEKNFEKKSLLLGSLKKFLSSSEGTPRLSEFFRMNGVEFPPAYEIPSKLPQISSTIKFLPHTQDGAYIPGSEIKGALRFLFVYGVLERDSGLRRALIRDLQSYMRGFSREKLRDREERKRFFKGLEELAQRFEQRILRAQGTGESYADLFRFVSIADTDPIPFQELSVEKISLINSSRGYSNYVVVVKPFFKITGSLSFMSSDSEPLLCCERFYRWPYRSFFNLNFLREAGYSFFKNWLAYEREYLSRASGMGEAQRRGYEERLRNLEELVEKHYPQNRRLIVLRLSRFQGFASITLALLIYRESQALFEELFRAVAPVVRAQVNKTRWVVEGTFSPLGWAFLLPSGESG